MKQPEGVNPYLSEPFLAGFQAAQQGGSLPQQTGFEQMGGGMIPQSQGPQTPTPVWQQPFQSPYMGGPQEPVSQPFPSNQGWAGFGQQVPPSLFSGPNVPPSGNPQPGQYALSWSPSQGPMGGSPDPQADPNSQAAPHGWDKFKQWYGSPQGRDSMLAGAIFGLSFTNPQAALQLAMQFREQQQNRQFHAEESQLQRDSMMERRKMEVEYAQQNKLQARANAVMDRTSRDNIDPTGWFRDNAPNGLDASNLDAFDLWETQENAKKEQGIKDEKLQNLYRNQIYKGSMSAKTASTKFPALKEEFDQLEQTRKDNAVFTHDIKEALLKKTKATTAAIERLSPAEKQSVKDAERQVIEIDDEIQSKMDTMNDLTKLLDYGMANNIPTTTGASEALKQRIEELKKKRADLLGVTYKESRGIGKNPALLPGEGGAENDPGQLLDQFPIPKDFYSQVPQGTEVKFPKGTAPATKESKQRSIRDKLNLK